MKPWSPQPSRSERQDARPDAEDLTGTAVDPEAELVEVVAVLAGRHDWTLGDLTVLRRPLRHRHPVVVGEVGVTGDDRVDVGADTVDDLAEVGRRVDRRLRTPCSAAPSWTSRITTSAPWSLRSLAAALVASTMSVTLMSAMPSGETSSGRCSVTAPTNPTSTPPKSGSTSPASAGLPVALNLTLAPRYFHSAPPSGLSSVGHDPVDEVVVALVELVVAHGRDVETGRVERVDRRLVVLDERLEGRGTDEVTGGSEDVLGFCSRSFLTAPASTAAPASAPRRLRQPAVEVVHAEDLELW